ncbi:hypothetical protein GOP47_0020663 [Adiantum capillus-veneris]|uniref:Uncharacterized protein n=1 Tax=Adiantum capillus-veneris TaxID=13818 RepID=A0A9D4UAH7_ADICA|nr:hypothetical protein GOP47_0020663 [Adiantum capillus-veneris]
MALCARVPVFVATGLWMQEQREISPCSRPCNTNSRSASNIKLARREILSGFFISIAAPAFHGCSMATQPKNMHLPVEEIKDIIENDIRNGQYYVTGDLTQSIYEDDCRFVDPTTDIRGVDKYVAAIKLLFDPNMSRHELTSINLIDPNTIQVRWKLEGYLKFPWHPHIQPYEGTTVYHVNDKGLIASHEETWDISLWTALREFLTPSL